MKNGLYIEFNEGNALIESMSGKKVNTFLLERLMGIDTLVQPYKDKVNFFEENGHKLPQKEREQFYNEYVLSTKFLESVDFDCYLKFYFDYYENDELVEHFRMDLGDGIRYNIDFYKKAFEMVGAE